MDPISTNKWKKDMSQDQELDKRQNAIVQQALRARRRKRPAYNPVPTKTAADYPSLAKHAGMAVTALGDKQPEHSNVQAAPPTVANGGVTSFGQDAWNSVRGYMPSKAPDTKMSDVGIGKESAGRLPLLGKPPTPAPAPAPGPLQDPGPFMGGPAEPITMAPPQLETPATPTPPTAPGMGTPAAQSLLRPTANPITNNRHQTQGQHGALWGQNLAADPLNAVPKHMEAMQARGAAPDMPPDPNAFPLHSSPPQGMPRGEGLVKLQSAKDPWCDGFLHRCQEEGLSPEQISDRIMKSAAEDPQINDRWVAAYGRLVAAS